MRVRVKLMAALRSKLPAGAKAGVAELDLAEGSTVAALLDQLAIPPGHVHLTMVNGEAQADQARPLFENDEVVLFPPVAGG